MVHYLKTAMPLDARKDADAKVRSTVETILADIETRGDVAVRELSKNTRRSPLGGPQELGSHTKEVLTELLELTPEQVEKLRAAQGI